MNLKEYNSGYFSPMLSRNRKLILGVTLQATIIYACSTALYIPKESARFSKSELREMQLGRAAYISKCGSCHTLVLPEKYNTKDWIIQVNRMLPKAHLTSLEEEQILKYLTKNDSIR